MKAAVLYGNEDIRYADYPTPEVQPGTVKVKIRVCGICGSDVPRVLRHGAHFYPVVLGHEFSGDVVEVGEGVVDLKPGDTVSCAPLIPCMKCDDCQKGHFSLCRHYSFIGSREQGGMAEYIVLPARNTVKYDPSIPYEIAAMCEPTTVALHGVLCNEFSGGSPVAVLGCGTIGIFTVEWARILGASKVVAFDIDDSRLALAKRMGADETVNTREQGYMEKAMALTGGKGFDYVFEAAGNPTTIQLAFQMAANKAHVCCIGTPQKDVTMSPSLWENMNRKEFRLTGSWMSYSAPFPGREWSMTAHYMKNGELKFDPDLIYKKYPMSQAREAFEEFHHPENVHGKILLVNGENQV
jgi:L-iditol 2-dehydrogenase